MIPDIRIRIRPVLACSLALAVCLKTLSISVLYDRKLSNNQEILQRDKDKKP